MRTASVSKTELARRLNWHMPQVDRLLDLRYASRLDQLEAAFRTLGKQLSVHVSEAPGRRSGIVRRFLRPSIGHRQKLASEAEVSGGRDNCWGNDRRSHGRGGRGYSLAQDVGVSGSWMPPARGSQ